MATLKTDRLTLRPLVPQDAAAYANMRYHPEVARWLLSTASDPVMAANDAIDHFSRSWRERGYAPWGVFRVGRLIGQCGLNFVPQFGETEVLWALHPDAWGQGYATEAARAALDFGFRSVGLKRIFAITKPDNVASQAVMKRLGLTYRHNVVYKGFDSVWFDINRDTFA